MISSFDAKSLPVQEQNAIAGFMYRLRQQCGDRLLAVILFGSRARGQARVDSDMDLAVIIDSEDPVLSRAVRYLAVEIWLEYGIYLSTRVWSQAHWRRLALLQTGLYRNLQQEGVELFASPRESPA